MYTAKKVKVSLAVVELELINCVCNISPCTSTIGTRVTSVTQENMHSIVYIDLIKLDLTKSYIGPFRSEPQIYLFTIESIDV